MQLPAGRDTIIQQTNLSSCKPKLRLKTVGMSKKIFNLIKTLLETELFTLKYAILGDSRALII